MNNNKKNKKATISVKQSKEKTNISSSISKTNVYIKGLNENITDNDLFEMCSKYGEIKVNLVDFKILHEFLLFRKEILLGYFINKRKPSFLSVFRLILIGM